LPGFLDTGGGAMEIRNCPRCGKLFQALSQNICPNCVKKDEELFRSVKQYIDDNPNCTLAQLSGGTDVSAGRILRYVKEGRLIISQGMKGEIVCESCGKPIMTGRYCDSCVIKFNQDVENIFKKSSKGDCYGYENTGYLKKMWSK
jgi:flagellar operon protein (TIGR03826 family)